MHYTGEALITEESFLRRLPAAVEGRARFDAIVVAADILTQAFRTLRGLAIETALDVNTIGHERRAIVMAQCWTIVDQLHAIRQLVTPPKGITPGPSTTAFLAASEVATHLRNKMDHLGGNIGNLSKRKGHRSPIFGSLTYFYSTENPLTGGEIITIMAGPLSGQDWFPLVNPLDYPYFFSPVDHFQLDAFETTLKIGPALASLQNQLEKLTAGLEKKVTEAAMEEAAKSGKSMEELLATFGGALSIRASCEFAEPFHETETATPEGSGDS